MIEPSAAQQDDSEPQSREELPWLKDPNTKISLWAIVKDTIGCGDISKITVPVYFNEPLSLLQKSCCSMEYTHLLDMASREEDALRRIALIGIHYVTTCSMAERALNKPFNPLLGETYEYVSDEISYLAEQVSHHPPIGAIYCRGKGFKWWTNQKVNTAFNGQFLKITQQYNSYCEFDKFPGEVYEIIAPVISVHNLVIGKLYVDIGETLTVQNLKKPNERCEIRFERRGWFSQEAYKLTGESFFVDQRNAPRFKIEGNWNRACHLTDLQTKQKETVWNKNPYPEKCDWMYGMAKFHM